MKKTSILFALLAIIVALPATSQTFTFGGRVSNYSTDIDAGVVTVDTGRESSVGVVGDYRNAQFVLRGTFDHDLEGGINAGIFIPVNFAEYQRDRAEVTAGWAALPFADIEAGFRYDDIRVGGIDFFGTSVFDSFDFEHEALSLGVNAHTQTIRPIGWYGAIHGYIGSASFQVSGAQVESDTEGWKVETGFPIPVGTSGWEVTPGAEWEHLETQNYGLQLDTNRFFLNFAYNFGR